LTLTCAFRGSPVPRCHRLGISPQPAPLGLRLNFSLGVLLASIWWWLFGVAPKEPGQAGPNLDQVSVSAVHRRSEKPELFVKRVDKQPGLDS